NFTGPVELREGQIGTFDASLSTDSSSDIGGLNYTWYTQLGPDPIGYGKQLELVCYTEEDLALQLMVTDDDGDIGSCSRIVNIKNRPPITIISGPSEIMEDEIVLLNGSASSDSPWDLDGLVYLWDIGEDGEVDSYERTLEVSFPDEGQKVITLTVIDSDGGSSSAVHHLAVNNRAPTPVIIGPSFANEDEQVLFKLGDDPDSISDIPSLAISWFLDSEKVGEGTYLNRTFTTEGEHTIEVRVNDDQDALGTFDLTLTVHNPRPSVEIKGVPTSVGPGDEITAQGHRSTDTPSDRGSLEFRWFLDGELLPDGSRNITFGVEEEGEHELMLRVEDDEGASNEISVTFTVERPPVLERIIGFLSSLTGFLLMVGLLVIILLSAYQMTKKLKELPPPERMPVENEDDAAPEKVEPDGTEDAGEDDTQEEVPDPVVEPEMEETDVPLPDMGEVEMGEPPEPPGELEIPDVDESIFDR
ncbi:MAG: PKD domain-containing protein, partial [Candidatus Thermoplasmatota archaeon]|nr:PKD domain-containing protein [Candidatus Thermoplasmatota archaeon]